MLNPLFSLCVYLIEMVISYIFFASLSRPKRNSLRIILVGSLLFFCASGVNIIFRNNGLINGLTTLLINVVFSRSCFDCPLQKSFFYTAILAVLNAALEVAIISASSYIAGGSFSGYNSNFLLLIFQTITIKTLYFLIILVLIKTIHPGDTSNAIPLEFLVFPALTTVCQFISWYICARLDTRYEVQFLLSISSCCLFVATVLLFFAYSHQVKKERQTIQIQSCWAILKSIQQMPLFLHV